VRSQSLRAISAAVLVLAATAAAEPRLLAQHAVRRQIDGRPDALVDLRTADGVRLVNGQWRYSDTKIIETDFNAPGADLRPSGKPIKTYDYMPKAGPAGFDDSPVSALNRPRFFFFAGSTAPLASSGMVSVWRCSAPSRWRS